jgi:hypothetical protein
MSSGKIPDMHDTPTRRDLLAAGAAGLAAGVAGCSGGGSTPTPTATPRGDPSKFDFVVESEFAKTDTEGSTVDAKMHLKATRLLESFETEVLFDEEFRLADGESRTFTDAFGLDTEASEYVIIAEALPIMDAGDRLRNDSRGEYRFDPAAESEVPNPRLFEVLVENHTETEPDYRDPIYQRVTMEVPGVSETSTSTE